MTNVTAEASVPALVLVCPKPIDSDSSPYVPECNEEHEGNVFVGLKFAMIIYLILAVGIASAWKLCQLL